MKKLMDVFREAILWDHPHDGYLRSARLLLERESGLRIPMLRLAKDEIIVSAYDLDDALEIKLALERFGFYEVRLKAVRRPTVHALLPFRVDSTGKPMLAMQTSSD